MNVQYLTLILFINFCAKFTALLRYTCPLFLKCENLTLKLQYAYSKNIPKNFDQEL